MGDKNQKVEETASSLVQIQNDTIIIDITQLHVNQLGLFHIIEIADDVDELTRVCVQIELNSTTSSIISMR